jgi:hypothetical protein
VPVVDRAVRTETIDAVFGRRVVIKVLAFARMDPIVGDDTGGCRAAAPRVSEAAVDGKAAALVGEVRQVTAYAFTVAWSGGTRAVRVDAGGAELGARSWYG